MGIMLVSKRKRYLSGSDWVINTLDHMMKASTCAGNMSQIVLCFDSSLHENTVRPALNKFIRQFPVLHGTVSRDLKLAPYWKIPVKAAGEPAFTVHRLNDQPADAMFPYLQKGINTPFRGRRDHLAFHLITSRDRSMLAMVFDHRIFDARGAELFLNLFEKSMSSDSHFSGDIAFASSAALTQWPKKFLAGRSVNRRIIALSKSAPQALRFPENTDSTYRYHLLSFSEQETAEIYERAYNEAGYLMESPYLLSVIVRSMHELFMKRQPETGDSYLIPVTMDLRPGLDPLQEVFFNYVSYLFYQIPVSEAGDGNALIALLKQQMYDQVKSGFPKDLAEASLLTRIAPLPVLGKLLHLPLKGRMASFAFSHLGKSSYQQPSFMGAKVSNIFHMPRVPVPPGLGFFSNYYNGRLSLTMSWLDGLLSDGDVRMIESGIRRQFGTRNA